MEEQLRQSYLKLFGNSNKLNTFFAPGRINLIGEHLDYNGGHVFPCALDRGTYAIVSSRTDKKLQLYSTNFSNMGIVEIDLTQPLKFDPAHDWANYVKGMCNVFAENGYYLPYGLNIVISGNIPNGAGLSSSASLEMLMATTFNNIYQFNIPPLTLVKWGQMVENNFIGVSCGIMDQFASMMGKQNHALLLDCKTLDYTYAPLEMNDYSIIIANTNKRRGLADSKYNERVTECQSALKKLQQELTINDLCELDVATFNKNKYLITDPIQLLRAEHIVLENARTIEAAEALRNNDLVKFGHLMNESHLSLKVKYAVTGIELDTLVEGAMLHKGTLGSRMTGAGFGGCTVSIVRTADADSFIREVGSYYFKHTGLNADFYVAKPGCGARGL